MSGSGPLPLPLLILMLLVGHSRALVLAPEAGLREMLREVGELTEDTQRKLQGAAREMDLMPERLPWDQESVPKEHRNEPISLLGTEDPSTWAQRESGKECIVDDDCRDDQFCETSPLEPKCLPRRGSEQNCTRDGQCTRGHLCIWGECRANAVRGQLGSICEQQPQCGPHLCCAFHIDLLFPVCTPLAERERPCHDPAHQLLDLVTWEMDPDGAFDRCPCARGLLCLPEGDTLMSVCKDHKQAAVTKDIPDKAEMEDLRLSAWEDPNDREHHHTAADKDEEAEFRTAVSAMLGSIRERHEWENPEGSEEYKVEQVTELAEVRETGADSHT